jgi:Cof subfamily protein (haloacid dehalogenase superfamily)
MKNLFISDLDGTLLNSKQEIGERSTRVINEMIARGLNFTVATARSYESTRTLVGELDLRLPLILNNGALVIDPISEEYLMKRLIPLGILDRLIALFDREGISFFINAFDSTGTSKSYYRGIFNEFEKIYVEERLRRGDRRFTLFNDIGEFGRIECIALSAFNTRENVKKMIRLLKGEHDILCHFYGDSYSDGYIIEITDAHAGKRTAVDFVRKYLDSGHVTCFGDNFNDIGMFKACDTRIAVSNACDDLKKIADKIIGSNEKGAVAAYLESIADSEL